ncbi:MAG: ribonuclease HII [Pseudomonadota bacterium]|nr:ribonuclease HII [Pseudomonadota bacterium]
MYRFIAGLDEAGRGPLAGPVVAAVVVMEAGQIIEGVRDSKKLSPKKREVLSEIIQRHSVAFAIASSSVIEIDRMNILSATMLAMRRAVSQLKCKLDLLRVDGSQKPDLDGIFSGPIETLVGGDDICPSIGAASILAKVFRDQAMDKLHKKYPKYGFDKNRGYPTSAHKDALSEFGPTQAHRKTFRPVRESINFFEKGLIRNPQ